MLKGKVVTQVIERDNYRCRGCGTTRHLEIHHIIFRSQGGTDEISNLVTLCRRCHQRAHRHNVWRRFWETWATEAR
ncbi:MAG: HNH endonuclease [Peptococcaceae bacterium]|nr:HNH endonuclease [Peptococcaceae bacterium]